MVNDRETQRSRGFGYVEFTTLEGSAKAVEQDGKEIDGRNVKVNYASARAPNPEKRAQAFGDRKSEPAATLFVGNLSFNVEENALYEAFGEYGDVSRVNIITDRETGAPKGFGYIEYSDVASATKALENMAGQEFDGRALR